MKSLKNYIDEKLVINKDFNNVKDTYTIDELTYTILSNFQIKRSDKASPSVKHKLNSFKYSSIYNSLKYLIKDIAGDHDINANDVSFYVSKKHVSEITDDEIVKQYNIEDKSNIFFDENLLCFAYDDDCKFSLSYWTDKNTLYIFYFGYEKYIILTCEIKL